MGSRIQQKKYVAPFCDWLIYETAQAHTIFNAQYKIARIFLFLDATSYGIGMSVTHNSKCNLQINPIR